LAVGSSWIKSILSPTVLNSRTGWPGKQNRTLLGSGVSTCLTSASAPSFRPRGTRPPDREALTLAPFDCGQWPFRGPRLPL
jgi:hypothetical protein